MFGLFRKGPLLGAELTQWQFDTFQWLLRYTGGIEAFRQRRLILPTPQFFPHDGSQGHAFAEMMFNRVKMHADMLDWPCSLHCQDDDPNPKVSSQAFIKGAPSSPGGTFRKLEEGGALITYHPNKLRDPMSMVATFAHELAHYRMSEFPEPPPGGWEVKEPATDVAAVFLGFGIFVANSRFHFAQYSQGDVGWRWQQQGYISEAEALHMHAIVSVLLGADLQQTLPHLKPALRGIFKRVHRDVMGAEDALQRLLETASAVA